MSEELSYGTLYLIPAPLADDGLHALPAEVITLIHRLQYFIVENARTARRFIKTTKPPYAIDILQITELDQEIKEDVRPHLAPLLAGHDTGLMSEAGCPGVADPGSAVVRAAHRAGIKVVPLTGPSSILLALMASGMQGQRFQFHGYLSPKKDQLANELRRLESFAKRDQATQIFIETPYRNVQVIETALKVLAPDTELCIAMDLTAGSQWVKTKTIEGWKKEEMPEVNKRPAVYLIMVDGR